MREARAQSIHFFLSVSPEIFCGKILVREDDSNLIRLSRMACEVLNLALKSDWDPC